MCRHTYIFKLDNIDIYIYTHVYPFCFILYVRYHISWITYSRETTIEGGNIFSAYASQGAYGRTKNHREWRNFLKSRCDTPRKAHTTMFFHLLNASQGAYFFLQVLIFPCVFEGDSPKSCEGVHFLMPRMNFAMMALESNCNTPRNAHTVFFFTCWMPRTAHTIFFTSIGFHMVFWRRYLKNVWGYAFF